MAIDPVCKMDVDPKTAAAEAEHEGQTYYFCVPGCKLAFERDPEKYLEGATSREEHGHAHSRRVSPRQKEGLPA